MNLRYNIRIIYFFLVSLICKVDKSSPKVRKAWKKDGKLTYRMNDCPSIARGIAV